MEHRLYPRVPVQISAVVTTEEGSQYEVIMVDVSTDGLGIKCNAQHWNMITPNGSFVRDGRLVSVVVEFKLPERESLSFNIAVKCRVAYSRRVSRDQFRIGFRFVDINPESQKQLFQFIKDFGSQSHA